jgi:hypothetical protein
MSFVEQERAESRPIETEFLLPEPYGHDRKTWIDNFTARVSV